MAAEKIKGRVANLALQLFSGTKETIQQEIEIDPSLSTVGIVFDQGEVTDGQEVIKFESLVGLAFANRISLAAQAFYKTPGVYFDQQAGRGHPFPHFTQGAVASEVMVDRFTGEVKILRTEILMDVGRSVHDGIDHGQVTGAFIQGIGWATSEKMNYNERGEPLAFNFTTYKIPTIQDIPRLFNVELMDGRHNPVNIGGSRAAGEPPPLLAISVFTTIKEALADHGVPSKSLSIPATPERLLELFENAAK